MKAEGIIQKVIRKWVEWEGLDKNVDLLDVEQDLIAEIKKEYLFDSLNCKVKDVREFLIGEE